MPTGVFANQAIITNDLSDNCPIHLLHKIQVSFLIWAPRMNIMCSCSQYDISSSLRNSPPLSVSMPKMGKGKSVCAYWTATRSASRLLSHYFKAHQSSPKHVSAQLENLVLFLQLSFLSSPLHRFLYIPMMNHHELGI